MTAVDLRRSHGEQYTEQTVSTISRVKLQRQEAWPRSGPAEQSVL